MSIQEEIMLKKIFLFSCLILLLSFNIFASIEGKISGRVIDASGNPVEKVHVTISSIKMPSRKFELKTDKEGKFIQVGLRPDYYQVSLRKASFMPVSTEVRVRIAETFKMEITLEQATAVAERSLSAADKLFVKGNKLSEENKFEDAVEAYEEAIKLSSSNWGYYFNLGRSYKKMEKIDEALKAFQQALDLNPESYSVNKEVGEALGKKGEFESAKKFYQKATDLSPDDPDALYNFGVVQTNLGENEGALRSFLAAV